MDDFLEKYLKETNTVLLTKDAFEYLKKRASVIDKIRAEIIEACGYSKDYVGTFEYTTTYLKIVLQIIDKYKAESEEE